MTSPSTPAGRENTIGSVLRRSVSRNGQATAIHFEDRQWTYAGLEEAVHRVAHRLLSVGLPAGARVATYGVNSDAYAILYLACAEAGLVHVPVNFALKGDELGYVLDDAGASLVVADSALRPLVDQARADGRAPDVQ